MIVVGISGSPTERSKTLLAVSRAIEFVNEAYPDVDCGVINIRDYDVVFCDGRDPAEYEGDTATIIEKLTAADALIVGTPSYRGSYTGMLKNLFDVLPNHALRGKPVGLIATAGSDHHYLAIEHELRPLLAFFSAHTLPGSVYAKNEDYADGELVSPAVIERLRELAMAVVEFATRRPGELVGPPPPTIRREFLSAGEGRLSRESQTDQRTRRGDSMGKPKRLDMVVDGERYRSAVSSLLADDGKSTFLFRALNSNYFVQREAGEDRIEVLSQPEAEELYAQLPHRHTQVAAAFPKGHGGVGMATPSAYDDEDEKERLANEYGVDVSSAYVGIKGDPQAAKG